MEQITQALLGAGASIVVALVGIITRKIVVWLNAKGITEKLEQKRYLVDIAVDATEQIYQNENGAEKLAKAKEKALKLFNDAGLTIAEEELRDLIEAAVKEMNDAYKDAKGI